MEYFLIFLGLFFLLFLLSKKLTRSVSYALFRLTKNRNVTVRLFHFLFLPGVFIHELSHLLTAEVLFVKTHGLRLSPEVNGDEVTMGTVEITKTDPIRRAIIGVAPVLVGFIVISASTFFLLSQRSPFSLIFSYFLVFLIVFEIGNTMFSSRKDLEGTIEILIFIGLVIAVLYLFGFNFPDISAFINSKPIEEIILRGIKILAIPIIIDFIIIFFADYLMPHD